MLAVKNQKNLRSLELFSILAHFSSCFELSYNKFSKETQVFKNFSLCKLMCHHFFAQTIRFKDESENGLTIFLLLRNDVKFGIVKENRTVG